jgi:hypothetical protein
MIFCENPANNEPSAMLLASDHGFNQVVQSNVVQYALLRWAEKPPKLWQDVAELHLKKNGDKILQTLEKWIRNDHVRQQSTVQSPFFVRQTSVSIKKSAPKLQKALQKYGATYEMQNLQDGSVQQQLPTRASSFGNLGGGGMSGVGQRRRF